MVLKRLKIFLIVLFKLFAFIFILVFNFFLISLITHFYVTFKLADNNSVAKVNDIRLSKSILKEIQSNLHSFDSVKNIDFTENDKVSVQYGLKGFIECYKLTNKDTNDSLLNKINIIEKTFPPINWYYVQVEKTGYYQGDTCFAIYINPDKGISANSLKESAVFAETLIRKTVGDYIFIRKTYTPSENIELISFSTNPLLDIYLPSIKNNSVFGIWSSSYQKILLNSDSNSTKVDIGWRLIHEMNHSFSYRLSVNTPSDYVVPEEAITEFVGTYIANNSGNTYTPYSPAIQELLKYISKEELLDIYFNGDLVKLKNIVDSKTYDGALCAYFYTLAITGPYGHTKSDLYLKAFNSNYQMPEIYKNCIYEN